MVGGASDCPSLWASVKQSCVQATLLSQARVVAGASACIGGGMNPEGLTGWLNAVRRTICSGSPSWGPPSWALRAVTDFTAPQPGSQSLGETKTSRPRPLEAGSSHPGRAANLVERWRAAAPEPQTMAPSSAPIHLRECSDSTTHVVGFLLSSHRHVVTTEVLMGRKRSRTVLISTSPLHRRSAKTGPTDLWGP